ncbi:MAG: BatA and WFA domain-containing protein [Nanoarchaeota archaeon]
MAFIEGLVRGGETFFQESAGVIGNSIPRLDQRFLFPGALILLLFLVPFIILYLIRPKPEERTISSLMFLIKEEGKSIIQTFFRTFLKDPLFIFHLIILLAIILAATHPFLNLQETAIDKPTVIVLDASASMQAESRFADAKRIAKDSLSITNTIILATSSPDAAAIDLSKRKTATIIDSLSAQDTDTNLYDAILLAPSYLKGPGRIIVISDFATEPSYENAKKFLESQGHQVYLKKVGKKARNIGIVDIDIKEKKTAIVIKNFEETEEVVRVKVNGDLIDTKTIPPLSSDVSSFTTPPGASEVAIDMKDDYSLDNKVYISAPKNHTVTVLIISNDENIRSYDFVTALDAINANSTTNIAYEIAAPPKVPDITHDIVIFKNVNKELLLPGTIDETLKNVRKGGGAIVMIQDDLFSLKYKELLPYNYVSRETEGAIEKAGLSLTENVEFGTVGTYYVIKPEEGVLSFATIGDSPIISFKQMQKGIIMYYGIFDESADFPKEPYYPIFWKRTIDFLSGRPDISALNYRTGSVLALPEAQEIKGPKGTEHTSALTLTFAGIYSMDDMDIAANLISLSESDINRQSIIGESEEAAFDQAPHKEPFDMSGYLLIAALAILLLELLYIKFRGDL